MAMCALTCDGCGGRRLDDVRDEGDFVIRRVSNVSHVPLPLPLLCMDCGGTSHSFKPV